MYTRITLITALCFQVQFYMSTFTNASIPAAVGYETGTPAYPDPVENPTHRENGAIPSSLFWSDN